MRRLPNGNSGIIHKIGTHVDKPTSFGVTSIAAAILASANTFSPSSISSMLQCLMDETPAYYASTLASLPIITPEETGTLAIPRGGLCNLYDGTNDYCTLGAALRLASDASVSVWLKPTSLSGVVGGGAIVSDAVAGVGNGESFCLIVNRSNESNPTKVAIAVSGTIVGYSTGDLSTSSWTHVAVVRTGSAGAWTYTIYFNGALDSTLTTATNPGAGSTFAVGRHGAYDGLYYSGRLRDLRIHSVAKSAGEIAAIYNQASTPTTIDRTGLLAGYWCEDEAGTTVRDWSGNGKHLTATNVTTSTFHATDSGVTYSAANELGHTLSGSTVIPRNEANTSQDVAGSALGNPGPLKLPATTESPCITGDGSAVNVALGDLSLSITSLSMMIKLVSDNQVVCTLQNSTATAISVVAGVLTFGASLTVSAISVDGSTVSAATAGSTLNDNNWHRVVLTLSSISCSNVKLLTNSSTFGSVSICDVQFIGSTTKIVPLQEGPGSDNTNRTIYWVADDGTSGVVPGAIVGGTVSSIYANRCPYVRDHGLVNGGRVTTQNLFQRSDELDNSFWTKDAASVVSNAGTTHVGTVAADRLVPNTSNTLHPAYNATGLTATAAQYTASALFKASGYNFAWLTIASGAGANTRYAVCVDLTNGTLANSTTRNSPTNTGYTITALGSGWYRVTASMDCTSGPNLTYLVVNCSPTSNPTLTATADAVFAGDGTSGVLVYGLQFNAGGPVSYQPTTSSAIPANTFVPGRLGAGAGTAADGIANDKTAGHHCNPGSRINRNRWGAPSLLRIGITSSDAVAPGDNVQAAGTADASYRRTSSSGDDRYLAFRSALTGSNKSNMESYCA